MGAREPGAAGTSRALVLNATFEPLGGVSTRRALLLVLGTKAELVHATSRTFRSERLAFPEPSVVRLARYVRVPHDRTVAVNRRTVFARDGHHCQYCGLAAESIDHVMPRSRGGDDSWENLVTACRQCNLRKGWKTPEEAQMRLARRPFRPKWTMTAQILLGSGWKFKEWEPFLKAAS